MMAGTTTRIESIRTLIAVFPKIEETHYLE
jgi:hypothetical protein